MSEMETNDNTGNCPGAILEVPPVPDDLKDRKAGFGFFIDDAFLGGINQEKGKHYSRLSKISIVRNMAEKAECYPAIFSTRSGAVVPCFVTHNTRFAYHDPPTVEDLNMFKLLFCIDGDPQWYELA